MFILTSLPVLSTIKISISSHFGNLCCRISTCLIVIICKDRNHIGFVHCSDSYQFTFTCVLQWLFFKSRLKTVFTDSTWNVFSRSFKFITCLMPRCLYCSWLCFGFVSTVYLIYIIIYRHHMIG